MSKKTHVNKSKKNSRKKRKEEEIRQQKRKELLEAREKKQAATKSEKDEKSEVNLTDKKPQKDEKPDAELADKTAENEKPDAQVKTSKDTKSVQEDKAADSGKRGEKQSDAKKKSGSFPYSTTIYFVGLVLYYELIFHGYFFGISEKNTIRIALISIVLGGCISVLAGVFPKVVNHILTIAATFALSILFAIQFLYHAVFQNFCAFFGLLKYTNQAADNFDVVLLNMKNHWVMMLLIFLPIVLVSIFSHRVLNYKRRAWKYSLILLGIVVIAYAGCVTGMKLLESEPSGAYEMYRYYSSVDMTVEKLGVIEALAVDVRQGIAGAFGQEDGVQFYASSDKTGTTLNGNPDESLAESTENPEAASSEAASEEVTTEAPIDTSPNVMQIDFSEIASESGNQTIESLCEYFENLPPTNRNEYTGYFEGYNVIQITAEGFSGYLLETDLFPTLSRMAEEGFVFENYYSPLWYGSTLGGEYANTMGSMPKNGGYLSLSEGAANGNTFLFSLGNQLKSVGYETYAFHNNSYTYYDRNLTHPALGYTWIANGSGLEPQVNEYGTVLWPQSDLVMIQDTFDQYTAKQPFHLYYLTVSGHVIYSRAGNAMTQKNWSVVEDLDYSETTRAYLACQYELEKAMKELIMQLKEHNLDKNTVIILAGDHVPYNNMDVLDELAGRDLEDTFEAYRNTLIIWSGSMEEPVHVKKVCSSIDILPTVSNLLGLEYDSRLIIGQDILSDSEGLVYFADRSFITDQYAFKAPSGIAVSAKDAAVVGGSSEVTVSEEELAAKRAFVSNKFTAADAITQYDFYKYVLPYKKYASAFQQAE